MDQHTLNNDYFFKKKHKAVKIYFYLHYLKIIKYSQNKILNICKFNLISNKWTCNLFALGGINSTNLKKVFMTKSRGIGFVSFINDLENKKARLLFKVDGLY